MSRRAVDLTGAWCGVALLVLCTIALPLLGGYVPPQDPSSTAEEIRAWYLADLDAIRVAICLMLVGFTLIAPVCLAVTDRLRELEGNSRFLTYTQVVMMGATVLGAVLLAVVWALAAFRPDDVDPGLTRAFNDFGWFLFIWIWPPFTFYLVAVAVAILSAKAPPFPRWAGYLSVWAALVLIPGTAILFFKTGPMAYNGLVGFYVPVLGFFIWVAVMIALLFRPGPANRGRTATGA